MNPTVCRLAQAVMLGSLLFTGCSTSNPAGEEKDIAVSDAVPVEYQTGKAVYDAGCGVCHDSSRDGAPRIGYSPAWSRRLPLGSETLVLHALEGKGMMPPKGENPELSEQQVAAAVHYMIYRVESSFAGSE